MIAILLHPVRADLPYTIDDLKRLATPWMSDPKRMTGVIRIGLFIAANWVGGIPGANGKGDGRGYIVGTDCTRVRVCIVIDYNNNYIWARANPSCGYTWDVFAWKWGPYKCTDAFNINGWPWLNTIRITDEWWSGKVKMRWSWNQSLVWPVPPGFSIDGGLEIFPPGSDWFVPKPKIDYFGDGYPTTELYSIRNGITRTVLRDWEGIIYELAPIWGDFKASKPLYMWYPGYSG